MPVQVWQGGLIIVEIKRKILQPLQEPFQLQSQPYADFPLEFCTIWVVFFVISVKQSVGAWLLKFEDTYFWHRNFYIPNTPQEQWNLFISSRWREKEESYFNIADLKRKSRTPGMSWRGPLTPAPHPHAEFFVTASPSVATATLRPTLTSSSPLVASSSYKKKDVSVVTTPTPHVRPITRQFLDNTQESASLFRL